MKIVIVGNSIKEREYIVNNIPNRFNIAYKPTYCVTKEERITECYRRINRCDVLIVLSKNKKYEPITLCALVHAQEINKYIIKVDITSPNLPLLNNLLRIREIILNEYSANNNSDNTNNNSINPDMYSSLYDIQ